VEARGIEQKRHGADLPGAEMRGRMQRLGILRESGHEHFNGSRVIPIFDLDGGMLGMYGRP